MEKTPKTPQEVLENIKSMEATLKERAINLARLKMWAQVALQGITSDQVRAFTTKEAHIRDSYNGWLQQRRKQSGMEQAMQMGRASLIGMSGPSSEQDPEWTQHCGKNRHGRYEGRVYTVALLHNGSEVRLDPPIVAPPSD